MKGFNIGSTIHLKNSCPVSLSLVLDDRIILNEELEKDEVVLSSSCVKRWGNRMKQKRSYANCIVSSGTKITSRSSGISHTSSPIRIFETEAFD